MKKKASWGGARANAGRPALPEGKRKQPVAVRLAPTIARYLRQLENASAQVETLIKRSKRFRAWREEREKEGGP